MSRCVSRPLRGGQEKSRRPLHKKNHRQRVLFILTAKRTPYSVKNHR